jgi:hypothetical protein
VTTNGTVTAQRRSRFASGAAVKLPLSEGDWVLVRAELTYGQQRRLATIGITGVPAALAAEGEAPSLKVDWAAYDIERLCTWVMDWSFRDADGDPVVVSREAVEALHPDAAAEVQAALTAHIEALEGKAGAPSPAGAAGPSSSAATSSSASASAGRGPS